MARPVKNSCDYFSHDAGMRNHRKIKAIRNKFGIAGYAMWAMLLESLTAAEGNRLCISDSEITLMAGDFGVSDSELAEFIACCRKLEMLQTDENGLIFSDSLDERLMPVYQKRKRDSDSFRQRKPRTPLVSDSGNPVIGDLPTTETIQSKVKEIKVKESKGGIPLTPFPIYDKSDTLEKIGQTAETIIRKENIHISPTEEKEKNIPPPKKESLQELIEPYQADHPPEMIAAFLSYWTEKNQNGHKERWEMERVFDPTRRLQTWKQNEAKFDRKKTYAKNGKYTKTGFEAAVWKTFGSGSGG